MLTSARVAADVWDAVVIGAGPAGAIAARQLALGGGRVLLVDRKSFPRRKVCGGCLNASGLAILDSLGLRETLRALHGVPVRQFHVRGRAGECVLPLPEGVAVSRTALDTALVAAAVESGVVFQSHTRATVGPANDVTRLLSLHPEGSGPSATNDVAARIVLAADGLGHPSLNDLPAFASHAADGSHIGAGCEVPDFPADYAAGTIHMAVGQAGYVGLTVVETRSLNVAAAFDASFVRECGGLGPAAAAVLREARSPAIPSLANADWLGTPLLTRRETQLAATRLFVLGDAAGYVEPFTGEGMTWGIHGACAVAPLALRAVHEWHPAMIREWTVTHRRLVGRRQRVCRAVASVLRHPWLVAGFIRMLSLAPGVVRPLVRFINSPPQMTAAQPERTRHAVESL